MHPEQEIARLRAEVERMGQERAQLIQKRDRYRAALEGIDTEELLNIAALIAECPGPCCGTGYLRAIAGAVEDALKPDAPA